MGQRGHAPREGDHRGRWLGSSQASRVWAAQIGRLFGARGVIIHVYVEMLEIDMQVRALDPRAANDALRRAERNLEPRAEELEVVLGSHPQVEFAGGDAAFVLLEVAREGGEKRVLIGVCSRGLGPLKRLRLGSVSTKVLKAARGPVLICPHGRTKEAYRDGLQTEA